MPQRPASACLHPGCPNLTSAGAYCDAHKRTQRTITCQDYDQMRRRTDSALSVAKDIRSSARWTRVSRAFRARWPMCCDPFKVGCVAISERVNHIEPLRARPDLAWHDSNHAPLCTACDARIGAMERRGESTSALFAGWRDRYRGESQTSEVQHERPTGILNPKRA